MGRAAVQSVPRRHFAVDPDLVEARGRRRGFEPAEAMEAAMKLFWAAGFEGASVDRLVRATGMPRATL